MRLLADVRIPDGIGDKLATYVPPVFSDSHEQVVDMKYGRSPKQGGCFEDPAN